MKAGQFRQPFDRDALRRQQPDAPAERAELGGDLELALACDLILATETARFGQPEAKLGFVAPLTVITLVVSLIAQRNREA